MSEGFQLVDGHTGTPHIDSDSLSRKTQTTLGYWDDILPLHNRLKVTVIDATHVQLWNGGGYLKGRFFYNDTYTKLEVKAGTSGLNRWDALVLRYHRDSSGVETVTPLVITGTPTSGQPSLPPTLADSDPYEGSRDADMLLGRIELTGTNIRYTGLANQSDSVKNISVKLQQEITDRQNAISREQQERQNAINREQQTLQNNINREQQERQNAINSEQQERKSDIKREQQERQNGDAANAKSIKDVSDHAWGIDNAFNNFRGKFEVLEFKKLVSDPDTRVNGIVVDGIAMISLRWVNTGEFHIGAWSTDHPFAEITNGWLVDGEVGNWSLNDTKFGDCFFSIYGKRIVFRSRTAHDIPAGTWHLCQIIAPVHK